MNISAISNRSVIGRLIRLPLALVPASLPMPVLQGPLRGYRWIAGSSNHGCWLGSYEYSKQRLFAQMLRAGDVVFDIGANAGFYTLLAASGVGPTGTVVAFEPLPENVRFIQRHVHMNGVDHVRVVPAAVGATNGTARFQPHRSRAMGRLSDTGSLEVDIVSIDTLCEARTIPEPTLMKIDVEGAELGVLQGAQRVIGRTQPTIFLATHGADVHRTCCDFLRSAGYELRPVDRSTLSIDDTDEILATPSSQRPNA